jgi:hypothetical protein
MMNVQYGGLWDAKEYGEFGLKIVCGINFFLNGILSDYIIEFIFIISGKAKLFKDPLGDLRFKLEEGTLT